MQRACGTEDVNSDIADSGMFRIALAIPWAKEKRAARKKMKGMRWEKVVSSGILLVETGKSEEGVKKD